MAWNDLPQEFIDIKAMVAYHFATNFNRVLLQLVDIPNTLFIY